MTNDDEPDTTDNQTATYGGAPLPRVIGETKSQPIPSFDDRHLDEVDPNSFDGGPGRVWIYIWEDESDRVGEMMDVIDDLRRDYIFATGTVIPTEFRSEEPLSSEDLTGIRWAMALGYLDEDDA